MYIHRLLGDRLIHYFKGERNRGAIVAGIVGAGKTTMIRHVLESLRPGFETFEFTGDDALFRQATHEDTTHLHKLIRSRTQKKVLVLIDEAQKSEDLFDAVKYSFDQGGLSFVISGSNPDYLATVAKKRLQRRASVFRLQPFSVTEILSHHGLIDRAHQTLFFDFFTDRVNPKQLVQQGISKTTEIKKIVHEYLRFGGLPLAYFFKRKEDKIVEIRNVIERGFESASITNENLADTVRIELARLDSQEFTYQNIFKKTGTRRRDLINAVIDQLLNHGYVSKRKPIFLDDARRSYLSKYSWVDPGIVTYLTGIDPIDEANPALGSRIESLVACKFSFLENIHPSKFEVGYFRPHITERSGDIKFLPGEIDFIYKCGNHEIPVEVKSSENINNARSELLEKLVFERKLRFGIVLYGGVPYFNSETKIVYWPFWL